MPTDNIAKTGAESPTDSPLDIEVPDGLETVGSKVAVRQLRTTRDIVASDEYQELLVAAFEDALSLPTVFEPFDGKLVDLAYEAIQKPSVKALDGLIQQLESDT